MNTLLAQSVQQHLARARLFEFLGYFLIGLVVLILLAGLLWSLRKRFNGRRRTLFTVGSISGLLLLTVVLAVALTIAFVVTTPAPPPQPRAVAWQPPPPPPPKTIEVDVHVSTDGTLTIAE